MGSFEGRSWDHLGAAVPALVLGLALATWLRLDLDALQLGPDTAASLGVDLRRTTILSMLTVGTLVGMATALTGVIGFVGLVVPHVARMWVGAGHRALLPAAAVLGAATLLAVDAGGRAVSSLALPPGAVTSLLGAPFFLWLLRRMRPEVS
jgi:iron complex transport system permease protein